MANLHKIKHTKTIADIENAINSKGYQLEKLISMYHAAPNKDEFVYAALYLLFAMGKRLACRRKDV